ncbi:helix-turn-helix domain-containing protein [Sandaracinobacter sp. RS1-74]|uniref:helix-turn-helix domain-containing protein n=1 Tax=Sandaracinobacteroides sayramensis TaxID=2913411 RepID=UPI001EDBAEBF|nr:helix-turn-helix transcriptional regulator [Sandaracinobacteroides sayramensis]MCG2841999.1 helix-turn-helix domain-containing protein [Sandaracinobacteroides sayramensis]
MVAESMGSTFGAAFGALVKRKRRVQGLTQLQLAEDAFGTGAKVRRISEIENGLVADPQPRTIDPLIVALGITEEELDACAASAPWQPDPELELAYRHARALLEAAAARFELARPNASLAEIEDHLREKAVEWHGLRGRIEEIDAVEVGVGRLRDEALVALSGGDLDAVDRLLLKAEEMHQRERTLVEVGRQSELRVLRGDAALVADDGDRAFAMYRDAARMFDPFEPELGADLLAMLAGKVYETSRRSLIDKFGVARRLLDELAAHPFVAADPVEGAIADYRRSLIYNREGVHDPSRIDEGLVRQALAFAESAVGALPSEQEPDFAIYSRIQVGNVHLSLDRVEPDAGHRDRALEAYGPALLMAEEELPKLVATVHNSMGAVHMAQRRGETEDQRRKSLKLALEQFGLAVASAEDHYVVELWGSARLNRGFVLAELAQDFEGDPGRRRFLRMRACAEFDAAIEAYPELLFPDQFGEANRGLATTLSTMALEDRGLLADQNMSRALERLALATQYFGRLRHPLRWAELHVHAGGLFAERARRAAMAGVDPADDIAQAKRCFEGAAETFDLSGETNAAASCMATVADIDRMVREAAGGDPR